MAQVIPNWLAFLFVKFALPDQTRSEKSTSQWE